jgi:hypothetical protein
VRWFLRYIRLDGSDFRVDRRGLIKTIRFLKYDSEVAAMTTPPLQTLLGELEREAKSETPDPGTICRALADYIETAMDEFKASFPSRISQTASILFDKGHFLPSALIDKDSVCSRIAKSLVCLLRSMETDPLDVELMNRAASYLAFVGRRLQMPNEDSKSSWIRINWAIRQYWDTVMRVPFGSLVIHRGFDIVLI